MTKILLCKDAGMDCDLEIHGDSEQEILDKLVRHVQTMHNLEVISPETALRARALIHDDQAV